MKKAFTLIELLAVIIILAVIALIATPIVLKVVDNAKESARKSSVSGYADTVRLALVEKQFETGNVPAINEEFLNELNYQGEKIACVEVMSSTNSGVILKQCRVGTDTNEYCFARGKVYSCDDEEFINIYENAKNGTDDEPPLPVGYKDNSGANMPELYDKMIPVLYNEETEKWQYVDISEKWYDYDEKWWANAVVLNPGKSYNVGQDIEMTDIGMMYVWIPRYKYTIFNGNNEQTTTQAVNIIFENGIASTGTVECNDKTNEWVNGKYISQVCSDKNIDAVTNGVSTYTHPAFTFDNKQLTGIWVGKFEISTTDSACLGTANTANCNKNSHVIITKPNVVSLRYITVSNLFTSILNIKTNYSMSNVDTHMIKNMEWGAIAYLKQSKYGLGTANIGINNNNQYITGCGQVGIVPETNVCNQYNSAQGQSASTTKNIYGIYDMSGGAYEYVMANMANSGGKFYNYYSIFNEEPDIKYYDFYSYINEISLKWEYTHYKLGDAIKETFINLNNRQGFDDDNISSPITNGSTATPWYVRGGYYGGQRNDAGIFNTSGGTGRENAHYTTRAIIINQ